MISHDFGALSTVAGAENLVYKINQFIFASRNIREVTGAPLLFAELGLFFKVF